MFKIFSENRTPDFETGEIIVIDKDKSWTSFDVVRKIKFILKYKYGLKKIKVGHAGTLDPLATGVVVVCTGKATKHISVLQDTDKEYSATIKLGETTPSYDMETEMDNSFSLENISENEIKSVIKSFEGESLQTPPIFSAVWHEGKRAYKIARKGENVELKKRLVSIKKIEVEKIFLPFVSLSILCSRGTYIRSLASDIGKKLDNGAFLYYLRRNKSGNFSEKDALSIHAFEKIINNL